MTGTSDIAASITAFKRTEEALRAMITKTGELATSAARLGETEALLEQVAGALDAATSALNGAAEGVRGLVDGLTGAVEAHKSADPQRITAAVDANKVEVSLLATRLGEWRSTTTEGLNAIGSQLETLPSIQEEASASVAGVIEAKALVSGAVEALSGVAIDVDALVKGLGSALESLTEINGRLDVAQATSDALSNKVQTLTRLVLAVLGVSTVAAAVSAFSLLQ